MLFKIASLFTQPVSDSEIKNIVPYECNDGYVGVNFIRDLAKTKHGIYDRDPRGIGLMDSFQQLRCDLFNPDQVHPIIRDFYENTIDYKIDVTPKWNLFFLPAFWLFRKVVFEKVGNANLPFDKIEACQGITSHIDTIDFNSDSLPDLRGWIRLYTATKKVIYVGIYTTVNIDKKCYVSVGFPFQELNLTATLAPINIKPDTLLLSSKSNKKFKYAGDYLVNIKDDQSMEVIKLKWFREEIKVYVKKDGLYTDHKFYFLKCKFLTLKYRMKKKEVQRKNEKSESFR